MKKMIFSMALCALITAGCKSNAIDSSAASSQLGGDIPPEVRSDFAKWERETFPKAQKLVESVSKKILKGSEGRFDASKIAGTGLKADTSKFKDPFVKKVVQAYEDGKHLSWQSQISSRMVLALTCETRYGKKAEINLPEKPIDSNASRFESNTVDDKVQTLRGQTDGITAMTEENEIVLRDLEMGKCWNFTTRAEDNCKEKDPDSCKMFIRNL